MAIPEVIENLPQFCYPGNFQLKFHFLKYYYNYCFIDGAFISKKELEAEISSFLLTDIEGNKTYGVVLKYFREYYCCLSVSQLPASLYYLIDSFFLQESENGFKYQLIQINEEYDATEENKNYFLVYVPIAILLLSKYSYYNLFKDCLSWQNIS